VLFRSSHSMGADDEEWCIPESAHKKTKATLVNNSAPPQGSNMERPMGMKKAKLLKKKLENTGVLSSTTTGLFSDSVSDSRNTAEEESSMIADMSSATKELVVSVMKAATSLKQEDARMRKHEKWMKMASIYAACGQHNLALAMMKKIEDDDDQLAASEAACKETARNDKSNDAMESVRAIQPVADVESIETTGASALTVCIECKQTPTTHKCRRCKQFVCDFCCDEKRGLQMIWWCGTCFDNESLSNQNQIREGKYESDNDDYERDNE